MRIKVERGSLVIPIGDVLDELTDEEKLEVARTIIWEKPVLDEVITELSVGVATDSFNPHINEARLKLIETLPKVFRALVYSLVHVWNQERQNSERWQRMYYKLYHAWPEGCRMSIPKREEYRPAGYPDYPQLELIIKSLTEILEGGKDENNQSGK